MQATQSKIFSTGLIAAMAMLALVASLFAVQPAFADDLTAGSILDTQSKTPAIKVKDSNDVIVAKSIEIKAEDTMSGQTGTWFWEITKGATLIEITRTTSKDLNSTIKIKGVKGGQATVKVTFITDSGKQASKLVKVNVYGIKSKITQDGIVYERTGVDTVRVANTAKNKDLGKATIKIADTIKLGDNSKYKAKYRITAIKTYGLNLQKKTTKILVGNNVATIGSYAFNENPKMKSLVIGKGVKKLRAGLAKKNCKSLKVVTIKSTKLTKANVKGCFKGLKNLKTVKVPASKVKAYKKIFTKANCGAKVKVVAI